MSMILYTDRQGGEWKPWNTPWHEPQLQEMVKPPWLYLGGGFTSNDCRNLHGLDMRHICQRFHDVFYVPGDELLPVFHSILFPTAARWDATNRKWTYYICGDSFKQWWEIYIKNFRPDEQEGERQYWWLDQGPGWSLHGVKEGERRNVSGVAVEVTFEFGFDWQGDTPRAYAVRRPPRS